MNEKWQDKRKDLVIKIIAPSREKTGIILLFLDFIRKKFGQERIFASRLQKNLLDSGYHVFVDVFETPNQSNIEMLRKGVEQ